MINWQQWIIIAYGIINLFCFVKGFYEIKLKQNVYGLTRLLFPFGIFVWGDAIVIGLFWIFTSLVSFILKDWLLFLLIITVFWTVRSLGETIYWLNQQYSAIERNPPKSLPGYHLFSGDSIWFIYQIAWQCLSVVTIILSIYFSHLWLQSLT